MFGKKKNKNFFKILAVSDNEILEKFSIEQLKNMFHDIDFIMSAGDVSNHYLDFLVTALNKDLIYVNGNHVYGTNHDISFCKNIDGKGLEGDIDQEGQKKISNSVRRVDAWAATWGIRQFQFFGCPSISGWRVLRRMRGPVAVVGSQLERARAAADDSDFAAYWRAAGSNRASARTRSGSSRCA